MDFYAGFIIGGFVGCAVVVWIWINALVVVSKDADKRGSE